MLRAAMASVILASDEGGFGIGAAIEAVKRGAGSLDCVEIGIVQVENDRRARTVGFGGAPNILGMMQCDASIMEGDSLMCGGVGALSGIRNPIKAARKVMERIPHVLLVAEGAKRFALEVGLEAAEMLSPEAQADYEAWLADHLSEEQRNKWPDLALFPLISFDTRSDISRGTVTFLVLDHRGVISAGSSTSGWAYKYPGRLGDSPIIGAGIYVDSRYGGAACTHSGEMTIRCSTAHSVVQYLAQGAVLEEACAHAASDLKNLKGGYRGPVIIHALDREGRSHVVSTGGDDGDCFWLWKSDSAGPIKGTPHIV